MGSVKQMYIENQDLNKHVQDQDNYIKYLLTFIADTHAGYINEVSGGPLSFENFMKDVINNNTGVEEL